MRRALEPSFAADESVDECLGEPGLVVVVGPAQVSGEGEVDLGRAERPQNVCGSDWMEAFA